MTLLLVTLLLAMPAENPGTLPVLSPAGVDGEWIVVRGRVLDAEGRPVLDAQLFAYHADRNGKYHEDAYRGVLELDEQGRFAFRTVRPGGYGPAPHVHFRVDAPGRRLLTPTLQLERSPTPPREVTVDGFRAMEYAYDIRWTAH